MYVHPFGRQRHLKNDKNDTNKLNTDSVIPPFLNDTNKLNTDSVIPPFLKNPPPDFLFWDFQHISQIGLFNISCKFQLVFFLKCPGQIVIWLCYLVPCTHTTLKPSSFPSLPAASSSRPNIQVPILTRTSSPCPSSPCRFTTWLRRIPCGSPTSCFRELFSDQCHTIGFGLGLYDRLPFLTPTKVASHVPNLWYQLTPRAATCCLKP